MLWIRKKTIKVKVLQRINFQYLPATTRLVPMNASMNVVCRIFESAIVREANRQSNVAKPSMSAPKKTFTYGSEQFNIK